MFEDFVIVYAHSKLGVTQLPEPKQYKFKKHQLLLWLAFIYKLGVYSKEWW